MKQRHSNIGIPMDFANSVKAVPDACHGLIVSYKGAQDDASVLSPLHYLYI